MRDPNRSILIVELLERAWRANPDQRLGQRVINAVRMGAVFLPGARAIGIGGVVVFTATVYERYAG
jgi:hypothetical protein